MNFQDELEKLIMDNAILGVDSGQAYFVDLDQAVTSIINLVDKEVIGDNYPFMHETFDSTTWDVIPAAKNTLKAEQRAIIRGSDETL